MADRTTGQVTWYSDEKGYGFIAREGGEDVYVHYAAIEGEGYRTLAAGQRVEFDLVRGPKGLRAERVVKLA